MASSVFVVIPSFVVSISSERKFEEDNLVNEKIKGFSLLQENPEIKSLVKLKLELPEDDVPVVDNETTQPPKENTPVENNEAPESTSTDTTGEPKNEVEATNNDNLAREQLKATKLKNFESHKVKSREQLAEQKDITDFLYSRLKYIDNSKNDRYITYSFYDQYFRSDNSNLAEYFKQYPITITDNKIHFKNHTDWKVLDAKRTDNNFYFSSSLSTTDRVRVVLDAQYSTYPRYRTVVDNYATVKELLNITKWNPLEFKKNKNPNTEYFISFEHPDREIVSDSYYGKVYKTNLMEIKITSKVPVYNIDEINSKFDELQNLKSKAITSPNTWYLKTDTGLSNIGTEYPKAKNTHSNLYYVEQEAQKIIDKYDLKSSKAKVYYQIYDNKIRLFATYQLNNDVFHYLLKDNINVVFTASDFVENSDVRKRLNVVGGYYANNENINSLIQILQDKGQNITEQVYPDKVKDASYLGFWKFKTPITIQFRTTKKENEVLLIDEQKIDVLDQNFQYDLTQKWVNEIKEDGTVELKLKNQYQIKIQQWYETSSNQGTPDQIYILDVLVEAETPKINVKWYAWDPENNFNQRLLIEKYLIDINGNYVLNEKEQKIPNPNYNPKIDPQSGIIKEIVWVDWTNFSTDKANYLPLNSKFLLNTKQIDQFEKRNNLKDIEGGFIAEASVINKGLVFEYEENAFKNGYKSRIPIDGVTASEDQAFAMNNIQAYKFNNKSQYDYFSSSGLWLFYGNVPEALNSFYRLSYITPEMDNDKSFTELMKIKAPNHTYKPFWETQYGLELKAFLLKKYNLSENQLERLSYEEVIKYYNEYTSKKIIIRELEKQAGHNQDNNNGLAENSNSDDSGNGTQDPNYPANGSNNDEDSTKTNIVIDIDTQKIYDIAQTYKRDFDFIKYLIENKEAWIINQQFNGVNLLDMLKQPMASAFENIVEGDDIYNRKIVFTYELKEEYKKDYYISNKSKNIVIYFLQSDIGKYDIFENLGQLEIDLKSVNHFETAKKFITNFLQSYITGYYTPSANLRYGIDFEITNWDTLKEQLTSSKLVKIPLVVKALKTSKKAVGAWSINAIYDPKYQVIIPDIKELENVKIDNAKIEINTADFGVAKTAIYKHINEQLNKYKLVLGNNIFIIKEFEQIGKVLENYETVLEVLPLEVLNIKFRQPMRFTVINSYQKSNNFSTSIDVFVNKKEYELIVKNVDKAIKKVIQDNALNVPFETINNEDLKRIIEKDFINKNTDKWSFMMQLKNAEININIIFDKDIKQLENETSKLSKEGKITLMVLVPLAVVGMVAIGVVIYILKFRKGRRIK